MDGDLRGQRSKCRLFANRLFRANDVYHGRAAATDGHGLAVLDRLDQFRKAIFRVRDTDFHGFIIAIADGYVEWGASRRYLIDSPSCSSVPCCGRMGVR